MAFVALNKEQNELLGVARLAANPDYVAGEYAIIVRSDLKGMGVGCGADAPCDPLCGEGGLRELVGDVLAERPARCWKCAAARLCDDWRAGRMCSVKS